MKTCFLMCLNIISSGKAENYFKFVNLTLSTLNFYHFSGQIILNTYKLLSDSVSTMRRKIT